MANLNGHEAGNGGHRQGDPKSADRVFSYSAASTGGVTDITGAGAAQPLCRRSRVARHGHDCGLPDTCRKTTQQAPWGRPLSVLDSAGREIANHGGWG
jgi:hypothetical protein